MSATVVTIPISETDLENAKSGAGAYATLEVPGDYQLAITDVSDWIKDKKTLGWIFTLTITEELGNGLAFKYFIPFEKERRNKMIRFFEAAGEPLVVGSNMPDPNTLVGTISLGGRIDFPRKYYEALKQDGDVPGDAVAALGPIYREVRWVFPLADMPDVPVEESETLAVPVLE